MLKFGNVWPVLKSGTWEFVVPFSVAYTAGDLCFWRIEHMKKSAVAQTTEA